MVRNASVKASLALSFLLICSEAMADVYVLGSSYSNDALPRLLDDRPQWHIDCGKPLQYIFDNPLAPCEPSSTIWPLALSATRFNHISFQPVRDVGVTEQSDRDRISYWLSLQPTAAAVIHPTWPVPSQWESEFHGAHPDNALTNYSQQYTYDLINKLGAVNPGRRIVTDRANEIFDRIYHDIQNGVAPLTDFQQLFRDGSGHLGNYGQYVAHNALRQAFGQRTGIASASYGIPPRIQIYLDARIRACRPISILHDTRKDLCDPWACSAIGTVGPQGGSVSSSPTCPGRGVTIGIPEGSLDDAVEISIMNTSRPQSVTMQRPDVGPVVSSVRIGPADLQLDPPATVTFHWPEFPNPGGDAGTTRPKETDLVVYKDGEPVAVCAPPNCDTDGNTFTIELDSAGEFVLAVGRQGTW